MAGGGLEALVVIGVIGVVLVGAYYSGAFADNFGGGFAPDNVKIAKIKKGPAGPTASAIQQGALNAFSKVGYANMSIA